MRTIKKICAIFLCLCLTAGMFAVAAFAQGASKEVTVRYNGPTAFKIGDMISDKDNRVYFENLDPKQVCIYAEWHSENGIDFETCRLIDGGYGDVPMYDIDENGCAEAVVIMGNYGTFFKPCTFSYQYSYAYVPDPEQFDGVLTSAGNPITFYIEEPIIQTNLVKANESFTLTTALTNVNLENKDVAYYLNEDNYEFDPDTQYKALIDDGDHDPWEAAYQPSVEILEGADIVSQSNQDYSNTLKSSETLTFTGTGTVKLRVKYTQFVTAESQAIYDYGADEFIGYDTYSPEKIITVQVTDGEATILPQYTVIKGANSVWNPSSNDGLTIKADGEFSKFTGIKVDDEIIGSEKYEAKAGSTVVILKPSYLKTLNSGKHTVTFVYTDGEVSTQIEIKGASKPSSEPSNKPSNKPSNPQNAQIPNTDSEIINTQVIIAFALSIAVIALISGAVAVRDKKYFAK